MRSQEHTNYTDHPSKDQLDSSVIELILLGFASTAVYLSVLLSFDLRPRIPEFLLCYFTLFVLYIWAAFRTLRRRSRTQLSTILSFAILFRIALLFSKPSLSDDIHRYIWEGYLQTRGVNPYSFAPQAPELVPLRNDLWAGVNNKDASAIYPPLIQMLHAVAFMIFRGAWGFKLLFLLAEAVLVYLLLRLLKILGHCGDDVVVYAWNPLVVVEVAGSGHHDPCVVALLFAAVLFTLTARPAQAVLSLGGSILCKLYPLVFLPFFIKRLSWRHSVWLPLILVVGYLPYASAGSHLFSALLYYREKWRFNGFLFLSLVEWLKNERQVERLMLLALVGVIAFSLTRKAGLLKQLYWVTGGVLLCAPTLFPWYLVWIVPFLCFFPNPAWLLLTALSPLSYYVLIDWWTLGIWRQRDLFLRLQYYPFYGLLVWNFLRGAETKTK
jgi:hypothetical protein